MIKFLIVGDVIGRPGRNVLDKGLSVIKKEHPDIDVVIINGENLAGGFGINKKTYSFVVDKLGVDVITLGNHWQDKKEVEDLMSMDGSRLVAPANDKGVILKEGFGYRFFTTKSGVNFVVMNIVGKVFMSQESASPFEAIDFLLKKEDIISTPIRLLDVHAEATSEKQVIGFLYSEAFSTIYGTHSHVPTCDERIINEHSGFITDIGMTGGYDSIIGMKKNKAIQRMLDGVRYKLEPSKTDGWLCGIISSITEDGVCRGIERVQLRLKGEN